MFNRMIMLILIIIVAAYTGLVVIGYLGQINVLFPAESLEANHAFDKRNGCEEVSLKTADNETINGLFFPADSKNAILYFHGNAGSLASWQYVYNDFKPLGYNFLIIDYRGYGKSTGKITEKGLYVDATTAFDYLLNKGFDERDIIIYGRSVGSGVAVDLARNKNIKALILEAPFHNLKKMATSKFPYLLPSLFLRFKFDNIGKINDVKAPLMVIHGTMDGIIPFKYGNLLYSSYKGQKEFLRIEGGNHNDLSESPEFISGIMRFLE